MKRKEILQRLGYTVPENKKKRVIIHTDIKNEADDHFAVMHHILTPYVEVEGIIAGHFEYYPELYHAMALKKNIKMDTSFFQVGATMEMSYQEVIKLLELAEIDDIPVYKGSCVAIKNRNELPDSEGADFIIKAALSDDPRPIYLALMGNITDLAIAYLKEPKIAEKIIAVWIGGADYPTGGKEFNMRQDIEAARIIFESPMEVWQVPAGTYRTMEISFAELVKHVRPCGAIGEYLCQQMFDFNDKTAAASGAELRDFPHGETWVIGDNPTLSVLLQSAKLKCWHTEKAPLLNDDLTYAPNPKGKDIRVYDLIDTRLSISDFYAKMELCYKK